MRWFKRTANRRDPNPLSIAPLRIYGLSADENAARDLMRRLLAEMDEIAWERRAWGRFEPIGRQMVEMESVMGRTAATDHALGYALEWLRDYVRTPREHRPKDGLSHSLVMLLCAMLWEHGVTYEEGDHGVRGPAPEGPEGLGDERRRSGEDERGDARTVEADGEDEG